MIEADAELLAWCRNNYDCVRVLPDGSIAALSRLMFTTGLFLGVSRWGYERRYCFESDAAASAALEAAQSQDDEPAGWVARRPERPEDIAAKARPGYRGGDPADPENWEPGTA
jgi:hypothetical protein